METMFEEAFDPDLEICEMCWEDEGFHFSWCPTRDENFNQTIDEEIMMMEEDYDDNDD